MNSHEPETIVNPPVGSPSVAMAGPLLRAELGHLRSSWCWLLALGVLLAVCGTAAIIFPALTIVTTFASMVILGIALIVAGVATIIAAAWTGKWSGLLLQLLVGVLYVVAGYMITDKPVQSAAVMTVFLASLFIVVGAFRAVAALVVRFPHWGWALLNGVVTFLMGVFIYRHFPAAALWVIGLLIGIEMLLCGWTWIMLALAVRKLPA